MENKENYSDYIKEFLDSISNLTDEEFTGTRNLRKFKTPEERLEFVGIKFDSTEEITDNSEDLEDISDFFINPIEKLDKTNKYPISQYQAFQIANENQNLKSDYCKNTFKRITYLDFTNCKIKLITKDTEKYWKLKITEGKISWVDFDDESSDEFPEPIFCDGFLIKDDFKKLQCLINANTGEYIYCS